ncbi:hypothetical protein [Mesorhizobium sp. dw_380]|uniref:hypothetical protein n=1 Tax=Mesorhizobium sp. dw_380 TaxID=2812001 RepID=UPI001BDDCE1C|nr:hypothetical protein [Mesorhizobium sp. dw_380]
MIGARLVGHHPSAWMIHDSGVLIEEERDPVKRMELDVLRQKYTLAIAAEVAAKRPDIVLDDGTEQPRSPEPLRDSPAMARALQGYRLLHQNASTTVLIRTDIAPRE